jgi:hypothetical protein
MFNSIRLSVRPFSKANSKQQNKKKTKNEKNEKKKQK